MHEFLKKLHQNIYLLISSSKNYLMYNHILQVNNLNPREVKVTCTSSHHQEILEEFLTQFCQIPKFVILLDYLSGI